MPTIGILAQHSKGAVTVRRGLFLALVLAQCRAILSKHGHRRGDRPSRGPPQKQLLAGPILQVFAMTVRLMEVALQGLTMPSPRRGATM